VVEDYRILDSAYKHGIKELEIHYVLSDENPTRRSYEMHDDEYGNAQDMYVAHTGTRPWPIEVGVFYCANENIVFHANKVTREFKELYELEP
jgi:hypothetical protein